MRGLLRTIGFTIAIALPGVALAQSGYGNGGYVHQGQQFHQMQGRHLRGNAQGLIRGTVIHVMLPQGIIVVRSGRNLETLMATPSQLAGLNQGDRLRLPYVSYEGALWLSPQFGQAQFWNEYGQQTRLRGTIQRINLARGVVVIDNQRFRAHPAELEQLSQGELVSVRAVRVGQVTWVTSLRPMRNFRNQIGRR